MRNAATTSAGRRLGLLPNVGQNETPKRDAHLIPVTGSGQGIQDIIPLLTAPRQGGEGAGKGLTQTLGSILHVAR